MFLFQFRQSDKRLVLRPARKTPSRGCAMQLSSVKKAGGRQAAVPRGWPPQARKGRLRPGKLQLVQSAAVSTCCQFWFTEEFRRKGRRSPKKLRQREAGRRKHGTTMTRRTPRKGRLRPGNVQLLQSVGVSFAAIAGFLWNQDNG